MFYWQNPTCQQHPYLFLFIYTRISRDEISESRILQRPSHQATCTQNSWSSLHSKAGQILRVLKNQPQTSRGSRVEFVAVTLLTVNRHEFQNMTLVAILTHGQPLNSPKPTPKLSNLPPLKRTPSSCSFNNFSDTSREFLYEKITNFCTSQFFKQPTFRLAFIWSLYNRFCLRLLFSIREHVLHLTLHNNQD